MATIGTFTKTDSGFAGTLHTLAVKAEVTLRKNADKQSSNHPDYELLCRDLKIGAAWERTGKKGRFLSVSFDDPSFAPGFYSLYKTGIEHGYTLAFERQKPAKAA
jgi:uncharacterized protein (DUF736 family)